MKTRLLLVLTAVFTLAACNHKTEKKVDSANDDWRRMGAIEMDLRNEGVFLLDFQGSAATIGSMDQAQLRRTHDLLAEYSSRGANVISTSQRRDVSLASGIDMNKIETGVRNAERLKLKAQEAMGGAANDCAERTAGPSGAIPKRVAEQYVLGLDREIVRKLDIDHPRVDRVAGSCRQFTVTYSTKRGDCGLTVMVDWNQLLQTGTDRSITCE